MKRNIVLYTSTQILFNLVILCCRLNCRRLINCLLDNFIMISHPTKSIDEVMTRTVMMTTTKDEASAAREYAIFKLITKLQGDYEFSN